MAQVALGQHLPFKIEYVDQFGAPIVPKDGSVKVSTDNEAVAVAENVDAPAQTGDVAPVSVGTANLVATDAVDGHSIPLSGGDIQVVEAPPALVVTSGVVTFGTPA
jgi:hypothetical protein